MEEKVTFQHTTVSPISPSGSGAVVGVAAAAPQEVCRAAEVVTAPVAPSSATSTPATSQARGCCEDSQRSSLEYEAAPTTAAAPSLKSPVAKTAAKRQGSHSR